MPEQQAHHHALDPLTGLRIEFVPATGSPVPGGIGPDGRPRTIQGGHMSDVNDPRYDRLREWVMSDPRSQRIPEDERFVYYDLGVQVALENAIEHGIELPPPATATLTGGDAQVYDTPPEENG